MRHRWRPALVAAAILLSAAPAHVQASTSPVNWEQESPATSPSPRTFAASAYDSNRNRVVLFGGWNGAVSLGDTWEFDGTTWAKMAPAVAPPATSDAAAAYDPVRGVTVLFGGSTASAVVSDTWEWNGSAWNHRSPVSSPPPMSDAAMVYDSARNRMLLFGGFSQFGLLVAETWEYDGTTWTQMNPVTSPSARSAPGLAFDSSRGRAVLFGGHNSTGRLGDTWEWDGANWTQIPTPVAPSARFWTSMAFDPVRNRTVLFGGDHIQPYLLGEENDTWEWDGAQWTRDWTDAAPSIRSGQSMVYDSALARMVMFGGWNAGVSPNVYYADTWQLGAGIVTASGSPAVTASASTLDFGSVDTGATSSPPTVVYVTSSGTGPAATTISTTGDFAISGTDCPSAPDPLAAGASCLVFVTFSPTAAGDRYGSLTFSGNLTAGPLVIPLHGVGILADFTISVSPTTINTTAGYPLPSVTVTTTQIGGGGTVALSALFSDPSLSATFSPASVAAGSTSTATITISPYVPGNFDVRVVGAEGSTTHYADVLINVFPVPDFTIAAAPTAISIQHGGSAVVGITTTAINAIGGIDLSATAVPSGLDVSAPGGVQAGGATAMTISAPFSAVPGQYVVTITGTEGSATHSVTVVVTVTPASFANGGFETGDLSGWGQTGLDSTVTYPVHSGTYSAEIGSPGQPSPYTGDSTISQTFDVPVTARKLVFWYWDLCFQRVRNVAFSATLEDGVTQSVTTLVNPVCTKDGATWTKVSVNLSPHAGHFVTLTFRDHYSGVGSTDTYIFVDDISLS